MRWLALVAGVLALHGAAPAGSVAYVLSRQQDDGGFAEAGGRSTGGLTAWAVLALKAAGREPVRSLDAAAFLARQDDPDATDVELTTLALAALGHPVDSLADRIEGLRRPDGRIGPLANSTTWGVLGLRAAGRTVDPTTVRWLLRNQARSGGWSWYPGGREDADDTAVTVEALRAAGVAARARAIARAFAYLRRAQNRDGGYAQSPGGTSNAQTTAWVLQAFAAAGRRPDARARRYLLRLRRSDGSFRYSARYGTTPLWVTSEVLPALAGRAFPLG